VSALSRREVLAATGLAVSVSLGGCLLRQQGPGTGHADPVVAAWYRVPEGDAVEFRPGLRGARGAPRRAARRPDHRRRRPLFRRSRGRTRRERPHPPGRLGIIPWGCEDSYTKGDMNYVDASERRIEPVEGTVAAPSA
jgi:hypothetical protein